MALVVGYVFSSVGDCRDMPWRGPSFPLSFDFQNMPQIVPEQEIIELVSFNMSETNFVIFVLAFIFIINI